MRRCLYFGPFRLDIAGQHLWEGDREVTLSPKALDLLIYLAGRHGEVVSRDELFKELWPDAFVDDHALSVQVCELRKALGDDVKNPRYIETRHRRGYSFAAHVTELQAAAATALPEIIPARTTFAAAAVPEAAIPETRYARSGDVNIAYQVIGTGPPDLVFVMGWVSQLDFFWTEPRFSRFLRRLATFARVILFDKRGTGLSDRVPPAQLPTIEQRMTDLRAVMDAAGSERAVICGVSEGGCMSAVFAATHPEKAAALIMIGSYARRLQAPDYPWGPTREQREEFIREIEEGWGGPVGLEERAPSLAKDPEFRQWWAAYLRTGASPAAAVALTRMNSEIDIRGVLPLVAVPTLVIHRADDMCLRAEEGRFVASRIPGARYVEVPGKDHLPFVGDQDGILDAVEEFVQEVRDSEPRHVLATVLIATFTPQRVHADAWQEFAQAIRSTLSEFTATRVDIATQSLAATFDGPARAVQCAQAIQRKALAAGLDSSFGLHTGECIWSDGLAAGAAVEIASAIHSRCANGDIVVSGTVRDLVAGSGIALAPCGRLEFPGRGEWQLLRACTP